MKTSEEIELQKKEIDDRLPSPTTPATKESVKGKLLSPLESETEEELTEADDEKDEDTEEEEIGRRGKGKLLV